MRITLLRLIPVVLALSVASPAHALSPVACTLDAKLCPDGVTYVGRDGANNCAWEKCPGESVSCAPYRCTDGTEIASCSEDGHVINYFAAPCLTHGGDLSAQSFSDVSSDHPNADAITYVKEQGIVEGYVDGTFKPDATINRAEFMKILHKTNLLLIDERQKENPNGPLWEDGMCIAVLGDPEIGMGLSDVDESAWYAGAVCHGLSQGLIDGYPDGTFRPANPINFVEAAKILANAFDIAAPGMAQGDAWYKPYVTSLERANAIPTSIASFDALITRGEMAEIIYRLKTGNNDKPSKTYEEFSFRTYESPTRKKISFQYPADWEITFDDLHYDIEGTENDWYRISMRASNGTVLLVDVNNLGWGPIFADEGWVSEEADGGVRITEKKVYGNGEYGEVKTHTITTRVDGAHNGYSYFFLFEYPTSAGDQNAVFERILGSMRFAD